MTTRGHQELTALLAAAGCCGCMSTMSVHERSLSAQGGLSLCTHIIAGFQPGTPSGQRYSTVTKTYEPVVEAKVSKYNSDPIVALTGVGWSLGSNRLRVLASNEFVVSTPYCRGTEVPAEGKPSEFRYACAGPTHSMTLRLGGRLEVGHWGFEAGAGVPYARFIVRRGVDQPLDPASTPPNERFVERHLGWSVHLAATMNYLAPLPPFGLAYRVEQYPYDAFGGGWYTAHLFAFYSNIYHKDLAPNGGASHPTWDAIAFLPFVVAPLLAVVMIGMNAACSPHTNTKC